MKRILATTLLLIVACGKQENNQLTEPATHDNTSKISDKSAITEPSTEAFLEIAVLNETEKIKAYLIQTKTQEGNPAEGGTSAEYIVRFNNPSIPELNIGCCEATLINEGDLDNDKKDELSVFSAPMNGCLYSMTTYTLKQGKWKTIIEPFIIPTACEDYSLEQINSLIYKEGEEVYINEPDINDENFTPIKKEIKLN
ncbi:hypothetical protein FUA48_01965 [Flavobacterium alkalisoli]|uniref:Lipoprotein n=1 Tax=Flavobacterium alkalisoli TaxID=2602769 RepID=A0A5B9FUI3_9FLAO|nr:hypothetical protein [Flavobacterium alkalisoli]QEE48382.1 hypothetical protein FUA48_01965 [Flavobacterium alkalisoli]